MTDLLTRHFSMQKLTVPSWVDMLMRRPLVKNYNCRQRFCSQCVIGLLTTRSAGEPMLTFFTLQSALVKRIVHYDVLLSNDAATGHAGFRVLTAAAQKYKYPAVFALAAVSAFPVTSAGNRLSQCASVATEDGSLCCYFALAARK